MGFLIHPWFLLLCAMLSVFFLVFATWNILEKPYLAYEERYLAVAGGKLEKMYVFIPPNVLLYLKFAGAFFGFFIFYWIFFGVKFQVVTVTVALVGSLGGFFLPDWVINRMQRKRMGLLEVQMVEALTGIANSLKAGFSFPQALDLIVREGMPPLSQEFNLVLKENRLGVSLEEALTNMARRIQSEDVDLVVNSVVLTRELGGNLAKIFERLAVTIRERLKLKDKVNSLTSQGRMQGIIVGLMPVFLGIAVSFINPKMMEAFWGSIFGWIMVGIMLVMEYLGYFFIKRIVSIDI